MREYTPISPEDLAKIKEYVEAAVGFNKTRSDVVTITNIPIDHTQEFREFDEAYFKKLQTRRTVLLVLVAVAVVLIGFILLHYQQGNRAPPPRPRGGAFAPAAACARTGFVGSKRRGADSYYVC